MLFKSLQSEQANAVFSDTRQLQAMLDFEAALSVAVADAGVIPKDAAEKIRQCCRSELFDIQALSRESEKSGNAAIPMVHQLTRIVAASAPGSEAYVHWGATSQDVIDTGLVLRLRDLLHITEVSMRDLCEALACMCERYADAPMAGRTWLQHAVPITFGLKLAGVLDAMLRHAARQDELRKSILVVQFGGAAGTRAALGVHGQKVAEVLARELGLGLPAVSWHSHRDRILETASFYGLLMATLAKTARDLSLMMQTEVGEVSESRAEGSGGSSTMPHKRNPVGVAAILSAAIRVPGLVSTMYSAAMSQEHERSLGGWQAEWTTLPELCTTVEGALENLTSVFRGLSVDTDRMRANLDQTGGLIMAEAVSLALAEKVGKDAAHKLVEKIARRVSTEKSDFRSKLMEDATVRQYLSDDQVDKLLDPDNYLGRSLAMIRDVVEAYNVHYARRSKVGA